MLDYDTGKGRVAFTDDGVVYAPFGVLLPLVCARCGSKHIGSKRLLGNSSVLPKGEVGYFLCVKHYDAVIRWKIASFTFRILMGVMFFIYFLDKSLTPYLMSMALIFLFISFFCEHMGSRNDIRSHRLRKRSLWKLTKVSKELVDAINDQNGKVLS